MVMKRSAALLVLMLLLLVGCGERITSGEVIDKKYTEAHTTVRMVPLVMSNGKTTTTMIVPYVYHYADKWEITIRQWDADGGSEVTATYRVTEEVYDAVNLHDEFVYDKDMKPKEPEYTRERKDGDGNG
jgi:ABC-type glycerol-3-phosphate transport system substrate-binding protein